MSAAWAELFMQTRSLHGHSFTYCPLAWSLTGLWLLSFALVDPLFDTLISPLFKPILGFSDISFTLATEPSICKALLRA
jgi:hypothetical protein